MNCYSCRDQALKPIKLAQGLPARQCDKCGGTHIDLLNYRSWRDSGQSLDQNMPSKNVAPADNSKALACQKCSRIMLKYRIATDFENHIDLCTTCDDAWLDGGEWQLLQYLELHNKLAHIMTEPWQRNLHRETAEENFNDHYLDLLGEVDLRKVKEVSEWLKHHPKRDELFDYMRVQSQ